MGGADPLTVINRKLEGRVVSSGQGSNRTDLGPMRRGQGGGAVYTASIAAQSSGLSGGVCVLGFQSQNFCVDGAASC